jgi:hypothetical protein
MYLSLFDCRHSERVLFSVQKLHMKVEQPTKIDNGQTNFTFINSIASRDNVQKRGTKMASADTLMGLSQTLAGSSQHSPKQVPPLDHKCVSSQQGKMKSHGSMDQHPSSEVIRGSHHFIPTLESRDRGGAHKQGRWPHLISGGRSTPLLWPPEPTFTPST